MVALRTLKLPPLVNFSGDFPPAALTAAIGSRGIRSLGLRGNSTVQNLDFLSSYTALTDLYVDGCPNLKDLTALIGSTVSRLQLVECDTTHIEGIEGMTELQHLGLDMRLPYQDLGALPVNANLISLYLGRDTCAQLTLRGITRWPHLTSLNLWGAIRDFSQVAALPALNELLLQRDASLSMLDQLPPTPQIRNLYLSPWREEDDLTLVRATLPRLQKLSLSCTGQRVDLTPLRHMPDLTIHVSGATEVLGTEHFPPGAVTRVPRPRT